MVRLATTPACRAMHCRPCAVDLHSPVAPGMSGLLRPLERQWPFARSRKPWRAASSRTIMRGTTERV